MGSTRTVGGQVANDGDTVEGQYTGFGPERQGKDPSPDVDAAVQGQPTDNDVEGQDNDARPAARVRPYAFPNPPHVDDRATSSAGMPPAKRRNF